MENYLIIDDGTFRNHEEIVDILARELERAFKEVSSDLRCFDWLSYNPDFFMKKEVLVK